MVGPARAEAAHAREGAEGVEETDVRLLGDGFPVLLAEVARALEGHAARLARRLDDLAAVGAGRGGEGPREARARVEVDRVPAGAAGVEGVLDGGRGRGDGRAVGRGGGGAGGDRGRGAAKGRDGGDATSRREERRCDSTTRRAAATRHPRRGATGEDRRRARGGRARAGHDDDARNTRFAKRRPGTLGGGRARAFQCAGRRQRCRRGAGKPKTCESMDRAQRTRGRLPRGEIPIYVTTLLYMD